MLRPSDPIACPMAGEGAALPAGSLKRTTAFTTRDIAKAKCQPLALYIHAASKARTDGPAEQDVVAVETKYAYLPATVKHTIRSRLKFSKTKYLLCIAVLV